MILKIIKNYKIYSYQYKDVFDLDFKLKNRNFYKLENTNDVDKVIISINNDKNFESLRLLVIL